MRISALEEQNAQQYTVESPQSGLEYRYDVKKVNDPTGKHAECRYFVLDPKHDAYARVALLAYASSVSKVDREFAEELEHWAMNP